MELVVLSLWLQRHKSVKLLRYMRYCFQMKYNTNNSRWLTEAYTVLSKVAPCGQKTTQWFQENKALNGFVKSKDTTQLKQCFPEAENDTLPRVWLERWAQLLLNPLNRKNHVTLSDLRWVFLQFFRQKRLHECNIVYSIAKSPLLVEPPAFDVNQYRYNRTTVNQLI